MLRVAVFVSGRGSNLRAIFEALKNGEKKAKVSAVVSNLATCGAFDIAREFNVPTYLVSPVQKEGFLSYDELREVFVTLGIELIVLAGFLKKIPDSFVEFFSYKIINIHPALLPSFGGKGMYGINVHQAVFKSSAKVSGATVHFVNNVYDEGAIIDQRCVSISECTSPEEIAKKVLEVEHILLPSVVMKFAENKVKVINNRVILEENK